LNRQQPDQKVLGYSGQKNTGLPVWPPTHAYVTTRGFDDDAPLADKML
jgi:hypothetical protein